MGLQWGEMGNIIYAMFGHLLGDFFRKDVQIIGLKAPGDYSDQFGLIKSRFYDVRDQNVTCP